MSGTTTSSSALRGTLSASVTEPPGLEYVRPATVTVAGPTGAPVSPETNCSTAPAGMESAGTAAGALTAGVDDDGDPPPPQPAGRIPAPRTHAAAARADGERRRAGRRGAGIGEPSGRSRAGRRAGGAGPP